MPKETPIFRYTAKPDGRRLRSRRVGWYVGYLETHDDVWFSLLNMDIRSETDLPLRKQLVQEALVAKGIIRQDGTIKPEK